MEKLNDCIRFEGKFKIEQFDKNGKLISINEYPNQIQQKGIQDIVAQLIGTPVAGKPLGFAIGTGAKGTVTGTTLTTETARIAFDASTGCTVSTNVLTCVKTNWQPGANTYTEIGIVTNTTSGGDLYTWATISQTLGASDTITVTYTLTGTYDSTH